MNVLYYAHRDQFGHVRSWESVETPHVVHLCNDGSPHLWNACPGLTSGGWRPGQMSIYTRKSRQRLCLTRNERGRTIRRKEHSSLVAWGYISKKMGLSYASILYESNVLNLLTCRQVITGHYTATPYHVQVLVSSIYDTSLLPTSHLSQVLSVSCQRPSTAVLKTPLAYNASTGFPRYT